MSSRWAGRRTEQHTHDAVATCRAPRDAGIAIHVQYVHPDSFLIRPDSVLIPYARQTVRLKRGSDPAGHTISRSTDTFLMPNSSREIYSHGHHDSVLRSHRWRTAENSAAYLLPRLKPGDRLLDVGVGPGTITVDFAERLTAGSVVGIDTAPAAVSATQTLAADHGLSNLSVSFGDVYDLDFPDASFDVVHAHQVLQHLSDPIAALREMRRVCLPGGLIAARERAPITRVR